MKFCIRFIYMVFILFDAPKILSAEVVNGQSHATNDTSGLPPQQATQGPCDFNLDLDPNLKTKFAVGSVRDASGLTWSPLYREGGESMEKFYSQAVQYCRLRCSRLPTGAELRGLAQCMNAVEPKDFDEKSNETLRYFKDLQGHLIWGADGEGAHYLTVKGLSSDVRSKKANIAVVTDGAWKTAPHGVVCVRKSTDTCHN